MPATWDVWARLNRAAHLDSPAPPVTPPIQFVSGRPVFLHLFYSAHPGMRFVDTPPAIRLLRKIVEACEDCGSPLCVQDGMRQCEIEQTLWMDYLYRHHGGTAVSLRASNQLADVSTEEWEDRVMRCQPGSIFYFTRASESLAQERVECQLYINSGIRHDRVFDLQQFLLKSIRNRDLMARSFLERDEQNANSIEAAKGHMDLMDLSRNSKRPKRSLPK